MSVFHKGREAGDLLTFIYKRSTSNQSYALMFRWSSPLLFSVERCFQGGAARPGENSWLFPPHPEGCDQPGVLPRHRFSNHIFPPCSLSSSHLLQELWLRYPEKICFVFLSGRHLSPTHSCLTSHLLWERFTADTKTNMVFKLMSS